MTDAAVHARFAVVGTGAISQVVHVPMLSERDDVDLVAVADADRHKAETIAERFGVPEVLRFEEILERPEVDAVVVCTPNHLHEEMAVAALRAGKHVFVERPLAVSSEGVQRILDEAGATGKLVAVAVPHRYRPGVGAMRAFVAGGELGRIYAVRGSWLTRRAPGPKTTAAASGARKVLISPARARPIISRPMAEKSGCRDMGAKRGLGAAPAPGPRGGSSARGPEAAR